MENQLNLNLIEGRLVRDPEVVKMNNGSLLCKFDIAVNNTVKHGGDYKKEVDFFSVNTWNRLAEACSKYLKKGAKVRINGKLKQDSWVASDGRRMNKVHINASIVEFMGDGKKELVSHNEMEKVPF